MPQKKTKKSSRKSNSMQILPIIIIFIILSFALGYYTNNLGETPPLIQTVIKDSKIYLSDSPNLHVKTIEIPAISSDEEGITGKITASIRRGTGRVLVDVSNILIKEDSEHSFRMAADVAYNLSNKNMENYDTEYRIDIPSPAIEGGSAGATISVLTYAALNDLNLNNDVMMTGTIHHDGTIGPASGILEKTQAAKKAGKKIFLVPPYQSQDANITESSFCKEYGDQEFCSKELNTEKIDISEETGVQVIEVFTIEDALEYFIK